MSVGLFSAPTSSTLSVLHWLRDGDYHQEVFFIHHFHLGMCETPWEVTLLMLKLLIFLEMKAVLAT